MTRILAGWLCAVLLAAAGAGPVEFGRLELQKALEERKGAAARIPFQVELSADPPETFRILPGRISGGDLRGLMYGLLQAADEIRARGQLRAVKGSPALAVRSVAVTILPEDAREPWFGSEEYWRTQFAAMAKGRLNRLTLAFAGQRGAPGQAGELSMLSRLASEYAVELGLGFRLEDLAHADGLGPQQAGPTALLGLKDLLSRCPSVRSIQIRVRQDMAGGWQQDFFRQWVLRAAKEAGRRVTLEFRTEKGVARWAAAAQEAGVPVRVGVPYPGGRQPGNRDAFEGEGFCWIGGDTGRGAPVPGEVTSIRRVVEQCIKAGLRGLEVDVPGRPAPDLNAYALWGRLSYDPATNPAPAKAVKP